MTRQLLLIATAFLLCVKDGNSHGRLMEPPNRSSMWRFGYDTPINWNDNELFCGGLTVQHVYNGGKCGICGDPWHMPQPRENEAGGKYGLGIIVRNYRVGQNIDVAVELCKNHKGYFLFKLCPNNNPKKIATQECLDKYPLELADGSGTKYVLPNNHDGWFNVTLKLPVGLTCTQCVLQWHYECGNNWGICPDGSGADGCGPQENFRGCADVAIA